MSEFSRRSVLGGAVAAAAATMWTEPVHAQYVWQKTDWQAGEFDAVTHSTRRIKQALHAFSISDARVLRTAKNSLNGLRFGAGVAPDQIQVVCALNGPANMLNYSDYVWQKYKIGEWVKENDPKTGEPAVRNIYFPSKAGASMKYTSDDPSSPDSAYQDATVQGLAGARREIPELSLLHRRGGASAHQDEQFDCGSGGSRKGYASPRTPRRHPRSGVGGGACYSAE